MQNKLINVILCACAFGLGPVAYASTGTWTNTASNASGLWTNNANWNPTTHPGTAGSESAFLTNSVAGAYTNILNSSITALTALTISNTTGQAWLVITNTALTDTTLNLNTGASLRLDAGGQLTATTLNWRGTNGTLVLNGGTLATVNAVSIGTAGAGGVTATVVGATSPGQWNLGGAYLYFGDSALTGTGSTGNVLRIDGAGTVGGVLVTNVGNGANTARLEFDGKNSSLLLTNGGQLFTSGATLIAGTSNNIVIGGGGATATWNGGGRYWNIGYSDPTTVIASYNLVTIGAGGVVTNAGGTDGVAANDQGIIVGFAVAYNTGANSAFSNRLVVTDGGKLFATTNIFVGRTYSSHNGSAQSNAMLIANGGLVNVQGGLFVGADTTAVPGLGTASFNNLTITNGGQLFTIGNSTIGRWSSASGQANSNSVTLVGGGATTSLWNLAGAQLTVGTGGGPANNNAVKIDGSGVTGSAIITNAGALFIGYAANAAGNSLLLTNGGQLFTTGQTVVGGGGGSTNKLTVVGGAATSLWNGGGKPVGIGEANSAGQTMTFNLLTIGAGGVATNLGGTDVLGNDLGVEVGWALGTGAVSYSNRLVVTDGGKLFTETNIFVGYYYGFGGAGGAASSNAILIANSGVVNVSGGMFVGADAISGRAGNAGTASFNSLTITNGGQLVTSADSIIGRANRAGSLVVSNTALISGVNSLWDLGGKTLTIGTGSGATGNSLVLTNGGSVVAGTVLVGATSASGGSVRVLDRGLLEANILTNGIGTGNTISNVAGIYQFTTNTPTISPNGAGRIAITNGTISFRAITNADVYANWTGVNHTLTNIAFAGANTFRLNAASNTTAISQNYTFNTGLGGTNYSRLEMINGSTAFRNGNITIGAAGSMLVSSTTATISGLLTNSGTMSVVGAVATYQSAVYNSGTNTMLNSLGTFNSGVINAGAWLTDPTTNVYSGFGFTNTISGIVSMGAGDVYHFTNTLATGAANFINVSTNNIANNTLPGKMVFDGGLGLTQQFTVAGHDLGPRPATSPLTATNVVFAVPGAPLTGFTNNFALGTLEISNFSTVRVTDAFLGLTGLGTNDNLTAGLYLNNLFMGADSLLIIDTNVQVYFLNSNNWTSANFELVGNSGFDNTFNGLHQLIIVPEPSVVLLLLTGLGTLIAGRRRRQRRR